MAESVDGVAQSGDAYKCSCGEIIPDLVSFRRHQLNKNKKEPGQHISDGRCDPATGEITLPPYNQRTKEQKKASIYGKKKTGKEPDTTVTTRMTDTPGIASEVKFVPRILTVDYSPMLRSAQEAATREWGWRQEMPLGNFIDTVVYNFFREHGIILAGYIVLDKEEPKNNGHKNIELEEAIN